MHNKIKGLLDRTTQLAICYNNIKRLIEKHNNEFIETYSKCKNWHEYQTIEQMNYALNLIFHFCPEHKHIKDEILEMLREDGFVVTLEDIDMETGKQDFTVSWGTDIPEVVYAIDGKKYNENIIG
uniref:Uncharacterized protein n=1 Tax=viral metagenome TaxID=1070528 RepID=A0A6C0JUA5_9ZZZZ